MTTDKDNAHRRGIGTIADVATALANLPAEESRLAGAIANTAASLVELLSLEKGLANVNALFCACQNAKFRETGDLYRLDDGDSVAKNYIGEREGRDAIGAALGL